jgi:hypothetical protein
MCSGLFEFFEIEDVQVLLFSNVTLREQVVCMRVQTQTKGARGAKDGLHGQLVHKFSAPKR